MLFHLRGLNFVIRNDLFNFWFQIFTVLCWLYFKLSSISWLGPSRLTFLLCLIAILACHGSSIKSFVVKIVCGIVLFTPPWLNTFVLISLLFLQDLFHFRLKNLWFNVFICFIVMYWITFLKNLSLLMTNKWRCYELLNTFTMQVTRCKDIFPLFIMKTSLRRRKEVF